MEHRGKESFVHLHERMQYALQAAQAIAWDWDLARARATRLGPVREMLGIEADASPEAFFELIVPDDRDRVRQALQHTMESGEPYAAEFRVAPAGLPTRWVEGRGRPVMDERGRCVRMSGVLLDIGARKRAELALARSEARQEQEIAALRRLHAISLSIGQADDLDRLLQSIVDAATEVTGASMGSLQLYDPANGSLTLRAGRGLDRDFQAYFATVAHGAAACGTALARRQRVVVEDIDRAELFRHPETLAVLHAAGVRALQATPLLSRAGQPIGVLSTHWSTPGCPPEYRLRVVDLLARQAADLIERQRADAEKARLLQSEQRARAEAQEANRQKDEFLALVSHELRTPLAAVLNWARVLQARHVGEADLQAGLAVIAQNAQSQTRLIEDLLDTRGIVEGRIKLERMEIELGSLLQEACAAVRPAAESKSITIQLRLDTAPLRLQADPARLQQVVGNLLGNAVKFTPEGGRVTVSLASRGGWACITVSDTGRGIKPEFLPHVFDRFRQQEAATSRRHGGLGLGLAIVRELTRLHGGSVRVNSDGDGCGTVFTVELPLSSPGACDNGLPLHARQRIDPQRRAGTAGP